MATLPSTKARQPRRELMQNVTERLMAQSFLEEGMSWPPPVSRFQPGGGVVDVNGIYGEGAISVPLARVTGVGAYETVHLHRSAVARLSLGFIISRFLCYFAVAILVLTLQWNWGSLYPWDRTLTDSEIEAVVPSDSSAELFDFASIDYGGYHIPSFTSHGHSSRQSADRALTSSLEEGQCWFLPSVVGHLGVRLPRPITVTHITIDHAPLTPLRTSDSESERSDAPRGMVIWGLIEGHANFQRYRSRPQIHGLSHTTPAPAVIQALKRINPTGFFIELAHFQYHKGDGTPHSQRFSVHEDVIGVGLDFGIIVLEIRGNWGANSTCLYRFRVHGHNM